MKRDLFYIVISVFAFFRCSQDYSTSSEKGNENSLIGQWQLVESSHSIGTAEQIWQDVENGYVLIFANDHTFESDRVKGSKGGSYEVKGDSLILNFNNSSTPYIDYFRIENNLLYLDPLSPNICFEGCTDKLQRVK